MAQARPTSCAAFAGPTASPAPPGCQASRFLRSRPWAGDPTDACPRRPRGRALHGSHVEGRKAGLLPRLGGLGLVLGIVVGFLPCQGVVELLALLIGEHAALKEFQVHPGTARIGTQVESQLPSPRAKATARPARVASSDPRPA